MGKALPRVTKGWFVEGVRVAVDDQEPQKVRSRVYHVLEAAQAYADALNESGVCADGSVVVRTREGIDKIDAAFK